MRTEGTPPGRYLTRELLSSVHLQRTIARSARCSGPAAAPAGSSQRASGGTRTFLRAESNTTIELAQISPSTVSGTSRPAHPATPCARTKA